MIDDRTDPSPVTPSRRDFLQQAAVATGVAALAPTASAAEPPEQPGSPPPTIRLGPHEVTRLIVGGNPVYGYSHFNKARGRDYYPCSSARLGRMVMSYFGKVVDRCSRASINFISLAGTRTPSG